MSHVHVCLQWWSRWSRREGGRVDVDVEQFGFLDMRVAFWGSRLDLSFFLFPGYLGMYIHACASYMARRLRSIVA